MRTRATRSRAIAPRGARGWPQRGYRVVDIEAVAVEADLARVLDGLAARITAGEGAGPST